MAGGRGEAGLATVDCSEEDSGEDEARDSPAPPSRQPGPGQSREDWGDSLAPLLVSSLQGLPGAEHRIMRLTARPGMISNK